MLKRNEENWYVTCDFQPGSSRCNARLVLKTTGKLDAAKGEAKHKGWYVNRHGWWFCPEHDN